MLLRILRLAAALAVLVLLGLGSTQAVPGASAQGEMQGDVTCDSSVNSVDSLQILRDVAGLGTTAGCLAVAGDVNCDGAVNSVDALRILRYVAGLSVVAPDGCAPIGDPLELPPTSEELIAAALVGGSITPEESLLYRAYALYDHPDLPDEFRSPVPDMHAGLELFREVAQKESQLSQGLLDQLAPFSARPADPISIFNDPPDRVSASAPVAWKSLPAAGGAARVWLPDGPGADSQLTTDAAAVTKVWNALPGIFRYGIPDTPGAANINPDSAIDIYFVDVGSIDPRIQGCDAAVPTPPKCVMAANGLTKGTAPNIGSTWSAYVLISTARQGDALINTLAHELGHVGQFAYDADEPMWLMDSTATWTAFRVVQKVGASQTYTYERLPAFFKGLQKPLTRDTEDDFNRYGSWLFFYFASMEEGDGIVTKIWEQAAADGVQNERAVDHVFKFADHFADFALRNVNLKPPLLKAYKDKDDTFPAYQPNEEGIFVIAPGTDEVGAALAPLSARYYTVTPLEPTVRTIRFENKAMGTADLHIWAIVNIKGEWQEPEDWTGVEEKEFCRDDPEQDVTQIILVVSNASMTVPTAPAHNPEIVSENIGCNGWAGTMTATEVWTGYNDSQTGSATSTFSGRWDIADEQSIGGFAGCSSPPPATPCVTYLPTGTISWAWDSHNSWFPPCDEIRAGSLPAGPVLFPWDQILQFVPESLGTIQYYKYWGHSNWRIGEDLQCSGPEGSRQPPGFFEISSSEDPQPGDTGGNTCFLADRLYLGFEPTISGSCYQYNFLPPTFNQHSLHYEWNLHAVGNPTGN